MQKWMKHHSTQWLGCGYATSNSHLIDQHLTPKYKSYHRVKFSNSIWLSLSLTLTGTYREHFLVTCHPKNVAFVCCLYNLSPSHTTNLMFQNVERHLLSATWKFVAHRGVNTGNKQSQLAMQHLLCNKLQGCVAHVTWPLPWIFKVTFSEGLHF